MREDLAIGSTDGKTGRSAIHSDTRNPTDTILTENHIKAFVDGQPTEFEKYVNKLVASFSSALSGEDITVYRGIAAASQKKINGSQIGPAPTASDGRYNSIGEKSIYLIDNPFFISSEIGAKDVLVQKYQIPVSQIRIADLSASNNDVNNNLSLVLQMTERGRTSSGFDFENQLLQKDKSRYLVSQSVAHAFKGHGWQGMYVPGVHGKSGSTYSNLALFGACVNDWEKWAIGNYYEYAG